MCFRVSLLELLTAFQERSKRQRLVIQETYTCAMVFAKNNKRGSYTGFFKDLPKTGHFCHKEFLLAHALPGPGSRIKCILNERGRKKKEERVVYEKPQNASQLLGFSYWNTPSPSLRLPNSWVNTPLQD